jgi:hypothetical protein
MAGAVYTGPLIVSRDRPCWRGLSREICIGKIILLYKDLNQMSSHLNEFHMFDKPSC